MSRVHPSLPHQSAPASLPTKESSHSFWHTQPSPLLLAHRSTRELPQTADVVVIGSGITGASVAHHLLTYNNSQDATDKDGEKKGKKGLDVVMLEAREACWGATGRNGGHCQPLLFESPHDASIGHFELKNFRTLQQLIKEKDIDCEFVEQPGVRAIYSDHGLLEAEEALRIMETTAPDLRKMVKIITLREELASYRIPTAKGAVVTEVAGRMWPYKFVARILEDLLTSTDLRGSFNLQTLTPASRLQPHINGYLEGNKYKWTVTTPRGPIHAVSVVLATNAYTSHLLPSFTDLIVPCRGQMSALQPLPSLQADERLKTSLGFIGDGLDDYLIQRPSEKGGHMMFGGGRQHGPSLGVTDDSVVDPNTARYLRSRLVTALGLPEGKEKDVEFKAEREWSGIMGFSRDSHPWIGPVPVNSLASSRPNLFSKSGTGLFMAAGFTGHGMPNTWLSGKAVALMLLKAISSHNESAAVKAAVAEVGLPETYVLTKERMQTATWGVSVAAKDWAEMVRGD